MTAEEHKIFRFLASTEGKELDVKVDDVDDYSLNVRFSNNLNIPAMVDAIQAMGKIIARVWLWEPNEDDRKRYGIKKKYVAIQGYRRIGGCKLIRNNRDKFTGQLIDAVEKIPAIVYKGISREDAENMMMDHWTTQGLAKSEIVWSIMKLKYSGHDATDIQERMASQIAKSGLVNIDKVDLDEFEKMTTRADRIAWTRKHIQNFVTGWVVKSTLLGPAIAKQCLFFFKNKDKLMEEGERVLIDGKRTNIIKLSSADTADKKNGQSKPVDELYLNDDGQLIIKGGGPEVRNVLQQLHEELITGKPVDPGQKMLTKKAIEEAKSTYASEAVRATLDHVLGKKSDALLNLDISIKKSEKIKDLIQAYLDNGGFKVKALNDVLSSMLNDSYEHFSETLAGQSEPKVTAAVSKSLEKDSKSAA